jgi:hypothetical protein
MELHGSHWADFFMTFDVLVFCESLSRNSSLIRIWQEKRVLCMNTYVHLWHLAQFFLELKMFRTKVVEKIKTLTLCSVTLFRNSCRFSDNVDNYDRTRQATGDKIIGRMRIACCITKAADTLRMYNSYWFFTTTMVTRTRIIVALYVCCLSCFISY